jgi:hypothetical protein
MTTLSDRGRVTRIDVACSNTMCHRSCSLFSLFFSVSFLLPFHEKLRRIVEFNRGERGKGKRGRAYPELIKGSRALTRSSACRDSRDRRQILGGDAAELVFRFVEITIQCAFSRN